VGSRRREWEGERETRKRESGMSHTPSSASHQWEVTTFKKPTYCDFCTQFIWGLIRQGSQCRVCHKKVHDACKEKGTCVPITSRALGEPALKPRGGRDNRIFFSLFLSSLILSLVAPAMTPVHMDEKPSPNFSISTLRSTVLITDDLQVGGQSLSSSQFSPSANTPATPLSGSASSSTSVTPLSAFDGSSFDSDFCFVSQEHYYVAVRDCIKPGFTEGMSVFLEKGDVVYRISAEGEGEIEGVIASGPELGKVMTSTMEDLMAVTEAEVRGRECALGEGVAGGEGEGEGERVGERTDLLLRILSAETEYARVWDSHHTYAKPHHATFWKVVPPPGFSKFSDVVERTKLRKAVSPQDITRQNVYAVATPFGSQNPSLAKPVSFELVWTSRKKDESSEKHLYIWKIIPPINYVSLGFIFTDSPELPTKEKVVCIHRSCAVMGGVSHDQANGMIWSSRGTSWVPSLTIWTIDHLPSHLGFHQSMAVGGVYAHVSNSKIPVNVPIGEKMYLLKKNRVTIDPRGFLKRTILTEDEKLSPTEYLAKIVEQTYFDMDELLLLYTGFQQASTSKSIIHNISKEEFGKMLPFFDPIILRSLFQAIDIDGTGTLNFFEYATALSIMCRGTVEERVRFAFFICDLDGSGLVEREELKVLSQQLLESSLRALGQIKDDSEEYFDSSGAIDSLFQKRETPPEADLNLSADIGSSGKDEHYANLNLAWDEGDDDDSLDSSAALSEEESSSSSSLPAKSMFSV
jgi:Ca2+-binding EF-hand superfamily protein